MLCVHDRGAPLCDGVTRREWLRVGGLGLFGLTLPALLGARRAAAAPAGSGRAKACIVLFFLGGPPQHETWDPRPQAPAEIRGDLKPIASAVPGPRKVGKATLSAARRSRDGPRRHAAGGRADRGRPAVSWPWPSCPS
jgi:hypothetical protein